ncbi:MAG: hypothetical protein GWN58_34830, partial [Anaerolineae bacterium]|nr:hypothetical protein [Anaerolineae bacterium]
MQQTAPVTRITDFMKQQMAGFNPQGAIRALIMPVLGVLAFLLLWQLAAQNVTTSLGSLPGPAGVWEQAGNLWA